MCNNDKGKVPVDAPISLLVCIGQGAASDLSTKPHVIEFLFHGPQTALNIAKTFAKGQLSKDHAKELIETRKLPDAFVSLVSTDTLPEPMHGQKIDQLRKDRFPLIDWAALSPRVDIGEGQWLLGSVISSR
jgi:hypothetical protein